MAKTTYVLAAFCLLSLWAGCGDESNSITYGAGGVVVIDPDRNSPGAQPPGSPGEAVADFHDGLQSGELDDKNTKPIHAMPFVAVDLETHPQARNENLKRLREFSKQMADDTYDFRVVTFKEDGDCAIVVAQDTILQGVRQGGRGPVRHFYLVRLSGQWKVLPRLASTAGADLTRDQREAFIRLVEWFEANKDGFGK